MKETSEGTVPCEEFSNQASKHFSLGAVTKLHIHLVRGITTHVIIIVIININRERALSVFSLQSMPKAFAIEPVNKSAKQTSARGLNLSAQPTDKLQLAHANSKQGRIASRVASLSIGVVDRLRVRFASSTFVILHKSKANALRIQNRTWQMENLKEMRNSKPDRAVIRY